MAVASSVVPRNIAFAVAGIIGDSDSDVEVEVEIDDGTRHQRNRDGGGRASGGSEAAPGFEP